ncbi:HAD-IIIA family hydrolase [Comamonadaceae bacterium G21597-S1]|nr:HAD-IIIA family hydrolase [Comamonadaceae bacterium G21597-S1]
MMNFKLVILDRDGTIGEVGADQADAEHGWQPLPGAMEAIARLNHGGWHVVIAANYGDLGRGAVEMAAINAQQGSMNKLLAAVGARVDAVFFCPHAPDEGCRCRKPQPGLFEQIRERFGIELSGTPAVGDAVEDLVAAAATGCEPHLVLTGQGAPYRGRALPSTFPAQTRVHADLAAFAEYLVERDAVPTATAN